MARIFEPKRLQELVDRYHPGEKLDPAVEMLLLEIAEEFVDEVARRSCELAKHRKSKKLDIQDVQLHLEKTWNMKIPGFCGNSVRRRHHLLDTTKKRLNLLKKKDPKRKRRQRQDEKASQQRALGSKQMRSSSEGKTR
mmetsp:Transcript_20896/g.29285  ORF Transcript_20896/g.29285 Transcript_20896/m.29285 type:complete len:138 (+) Transcript_20896:95-508(+)|eukprot:CAMPEP_0185263206 /NCGR_PEP_ID=MMETSP1359-20130426/12674_1 /TAXON_ID=552665 /ORGANISM="Bigelowiella longifila, Strain CCMP242" /LENGTH=137 /DNA_ID=CAMNT_0027850491 /DNA_START=95 /DNA_END=508 /DNA_ORIENTATION=+